MVTHRTKCSCEGSTSKWSCCRGFYVA